MKNNPIVVLGRRISALLDRAWPCVCCICAQSGADELDLCRPCHSHFPYLDIQAMPESASARFMTLCLACGRPLSLGACFCADCAKISSTYAQLIIPFRYSFPIDRLITGLKYGAKLSYGRVLGGLLADEVRRTGNVMPDALVPMPMHNTRYRQRGFNQSHELAYWCAQRLQINIENDWVHRRTNTPSLAGLSKASRELEIRGAFKADDAVRGMHIAIVDDVLTTGASSSELARELYDTGAANVSLWVIARTATSGSSPAGFINRRINEEGEPLRILCD